MADLDKRTEPGALSLDDAVALLNDRDVTKVKLPYPLNGWIQKIQVDAFDGYIRVSELADGRPVELFIVMSKEGHTISGLLRSLGKSISIGLRCGVPLRYYTKALKGMRFVPEGYGRYGDVAQPFTSLVDCIARALITAYPDRHTDEERGVVEPGPGPVPNLEEPVPGFTGETCIKCQSPLLVQTGKCKTCMDCGETGGCG